ncbi:hypothetical protein ABN028_27620 [Actinopolymorpha sp. B17G11]
MIVSVSPPHRPDQAVPAYLADQPFLLREARQLGLSEDVVRGQRFRRVFRGVYVGAGTPDSVRLRAGAARLLLPDAAVFSHHTAAQLGDLPVPDEPAIHVTLPQELQRRRVPGIVTHRSLSVTARSFAGFAVTTPERTFLDLAKQLSLVDLTVLGDAMVRRHFTTAERLREAASAANGRRGVPLARKSAALVRPRVDSPMETRVRLLVVLAGLPCPEPGREILDEYGQWVATPDLLYRAQRIAIEYDGELHYRRRCKWRQDLSTRDLLREMGWHVIVLTAEDVFRTPLHTLHRIHDSLAGRAYPRLPATLDPRWEQHFPPRFDTLSA